MEKSTRKTTLLVLLLASSIFTNMAQGTPPNPYHPGFGPSKITLSKEPKLGEIITLTYTITPKADIPNARIKFACSEGVEFVSAKDNIEILNRILARVYYSASKNKSKSFKLNVRFVSNSGSISVTANVYEKDKNSKEYVGLSFGRSYINRLLVDTVTGRLGTTGEYYSGIIHRYDPAAGEFLKESDPGVGDINRGIVKQMKSFDPTLSDSEALALHGDMMQGIMFSIGVSKKDASKPAKEVEDMIIKYLLREGWLEKMKNGTKDKWFQQLKKDSKEKWDKSENNNEGSKGTFIFSGQWKYKKHAYNKDQGLLTTTQDDLVRQSKVRVRAYWLGSGTNWYTCYTDVNGNFVVTGYDIPIDRNIYTHPILYLWNYDNIVKVSDPTPSISTWRDPADTTIWFLNRAGSNVDTVWGGSGGHDFGAVYPESLKAG